MRPVSFLSSAIHPGRVASWRPNVADVLVEPTCGTQRFILRELIDGPRSTTQLIARVYDDGEDEPGNPARCIYVAICNLNKKLRPGWRIVSIPNPYALNARGPQRRYELQKDM